MHEHTRERNRSGEERDPGRTLEACPECAEDAVVRSTDRGELVCGACGLVVDETNIDHGPEWRAFDHRERRRKARTGAPMTETLHDRGLSTTIDWRDEDAYGRAIPSEKRSQLRRLRTWQERIRTKDAGERNLRFALSEIDRMASALGVPRQTREVASVVYRRALAEDLVRGRSIEAMASGALYAACRQEGYPRSLDEVTKVARVSEIEVGRAYRHLARELGLNLKPTDPKLFLPRFASELGLDESVVAQAKEIVDVASEAGLQSGKSPDGFAASALYAAGLLCDDKRTQTEVAAVANVTEVTIRNRYREQIEALGLV